MLAQIPGIPGGPEIFILIVIVLIIVLAFVLIRSLVRVFGGGGTDDARIADLERRVADLEREHE